jgi:IS4 transposase
MFDWAKYQRTKGAIKLHLLLDHDGCLPCFVQMTEGKQHEINVARGLEFPRNAIVVFDRGYLDFEWMKSLEDRGVYFVTRAKSNLIWCDEGDLPGPPKQPDPRVLSDKLVTLAGAPNVLWRRVEWLDPESGKVLVFLTNHLELSASTIAEIYRQRWQIEIFFKTIKQNLKIKSFVGTSANAVQIQIWTALIAILLLKFLQFRSRIGWSVSNLVALLRLNLFLHKNLWEWIDAPFDVVLEQDVNRQAELAFT